MGCLACMVHFKIIIFVNGILFAPHGICGGYISYVAPMCYFT